MPADMLLMDPGYGIGFFIVVSLYNCLQLIFVLVILQMFLGYLFLLYF